MKSLDQARPGFGIFVAVHPPRQAPDARRAQPRRLRCRASGLAGRCLGSTNLIYSTHSSVQHKTRRVINWKNGPVALWWAAATFVETEKSYRRIVGCGHLRILKAHLDDHEPVAEMKTAG